MKPKKVFSFGAVTAIILVAATSAFAQAQTRIGDLSGARAGITISGKVVGFGESDENEWILDDGTGTIVVDAGPRSWRNINVTKGETITVVGEIDDGEFDAFSVTLSNGSVIDIRSPQGPPPWAQRRR